MKLRAVPSSCPPAPPKPVPTHTDRLHSRSLSIDGTLGGGARRGTRISPPPFPGSAQLQDGIRASPIAASATTPTTPRMPALSLKWIGEWGRSQKPANRSRALRPQDTKRVKLREILFLPATPHLTLQEGSFPAVELPAISG